MSDLVTAQREFALQTQDTTPAQPSYPVPTDPLAMIADGIRSGIDADTMRAMMEMRKELKAEQAREAFLSALSELQAELPRIEKTKQVKDKSGKVRYAYAPLDSIIEQCKPYLKAHGFSYTMKPVQDQGDSFTARIIVHHSAGHQEETSFTVPIDSESYMNAPQKVGSARTFAMRYAFTNAFGILTADMDDDAGTFDVDTALAHAKRIEEIHAAEDMDALRDVFLRHFKALGGDRAAQKLIAAAKDERKKELANG